MHGSVTDRQTDIHTPTESIAHNHEPHAKVLGNEVANPTCYGIAFLPQYQYRDFILCCMCCVPKQVGVLVKTECGARLWEFNLRDILRWCQLMKDSQVIIHVYTGPGIYAWASEPLWPLRPWPYHFFAHELYSTNKLQCARLVNHIEVVYGFILQE